MKKKLLAVLLLASFMSFAQFNPNAPWMKELPKKQGSANFSRGTNLHEIYTFEEITTAFHEYWKDKDRNAKGNGYKPFMRWENYWKHFVKPDGYLPTAKELWQAYENKEASASRGPVNPTSDWSTIGPINSGELAIGQPGIGRINAVAVDPNNDQIWYAGAPAGGIWKSTDAGSTWTTLFEDLPQIGVSGIAIDPNDSDIIYIATGDDDATDSFSIGVFKSTDGGLTWSPTGLGPDTQENFDVMNEIFIDPTDSNTIWVGGTQGLLKSTDAGATWEVKLSGNVTDYRLKPGDPNTIYALTGRTGRTNGPVGYFKSTDGGDTFIEINDFIPNGAIRGVIAVTEADAENVYILFANSENSGSQYEGLFVSLDSGENFSRTENDENIITRNQAIYDLAIAVSPTDSNEIYTGAINIYKSTDQGDNFTLLNNNDNVVGPAYTHVDIHTLKFFGNKLFAGTDGGFFVSEDNGASFDDYSDGLSVTQFYRISIAKNNANRIAGGTQDNSGFVYDDNEWSIYTSGDGMDYEIDPTNSSIVYGFTQFGTFLYTSTTFGQSIGAVFAPENIDGNWITPLAIDSEGTVYAGFNAVYRLNGNAWERISNFFTEGDNIDDLEIDPNNPLIMYAANEGDLYRSENGGVTFEQINSSSEPFNLQISDIAINHNDSNIVYLTTAFRVGSADFQQPSERGVYKVTVNGNELVSSENITFDLPTDQTFFCVVHQPRSPNDAIYVGTSLGVYRWDETLTEWDQYSTNFPNTAVSDLEISPDDEVIVASTYGRGAWVSPIPVTLPSDDVRLLSVSPNGDAISCGEPVPEATVQNKGLNPITEINFKYVINGGNEIDFTWNGTLASEESTVVQLPAIGASLTGRVSYDLSAEVVNDAFSENNDVSSTFIINENSSAGTSFDFENEANSLITFNQTGEDSVWERGVPTGELLNMASSGTQVLGTNLDGNYPDDTKGFILSKCYDLSTVTAPVLKFNMAFDLEENWDIVYVEYSVDEGDVWQVLGQLGSQPNWYNSNRTNASSGADNDCQNCPGAQWTGTEATMTEYAYNFQSNAGQGETDLTNEDNIIFRIVFHSDAFVNQEGVIVDDFVVEGLQDDDDDDDDGILDVDDNCPFIANADQADNDNDGEGDVCDPDDDNDGILDIDDNCPLTANSDQADDDNDGIGNVCDNDADNDGVSNDLDLCPDTPSDSTIDVDGCPIFTLPATNFSIQTVGESCISSDNGEISINAENIALDYVAALVGTNTDLSNTFTESTSFSNLASGTYQLCLTVVGQSDYELCTELTIEEPEPLSVSSKVSTLDNEVEITLNGADFYTIILNGKTFETSRNSITLPLDKIENKLEVKTNLECQGVYLETIILSNDFFVYPNPVESGNISIYLGDQTQGPVDVSLFSTNGRQIIGKQVNTDSNTIELGIDSLTNGVYLLNVRNNNSLKTYKIIKR